MQNYKQRSVSIDFLRFVAIFLVLGRHLEPADGDYFGKSFFEVWHRGGWVGVDLFFVISGFLISGLLFSEYKEHKNIRFFHFILRRGFKIYPAFYALLIFRVLSFTFSSQMTPDLKTRAVHDALFIQNYFNPLNIHTWSLAVEEHFYIILPLLLIALYKYSRNRENPFGMIPLLVAVIAIAELGLRLYNAHYLPFRLLQNVFATHIRIDSLLFGVLLSYFAFYHKPKFEEVCIKYKNVFFVLGILLLVPVFLFELETTPFHYSFGFTFYYIGSGLLFCSIACSQRRHGLLERGMAWFGKYSYSIYLWHVLVGALYLHLLKKYLHTSVSIEVGVVLYLVLSIAFGVMMGELIEWPMLKLRDRFFPKREKVKPNRHAFSTREPGQLIDGQAIRTADF